MNPKLERAALLRQSIKGGARVVTAPQLFETPAPIVARMIAAAELSPGLRVLEPSAGTGQLANAARAVGCNVQCVEINADLCELLCQQGHAVDRADFLTWHGSELYDRVLMNPPFQLGADAAHVQQAYEHLIPGGVLVAILSTGPFFRERRKDKDFRAWFDSVGGHRENLPPESFKTSGTGVNTVIARIEAA